MAAVTGAALDAVEVGGLIREDVMEKIWQIDNVPLPLTMRIGTDSHDRSYNEWTTEELAAPATDNAAVDGADITTDDEKLGERKGNHSQISTKRVTVSTRSQNSGTIGYANALSHQISQRQKELRRDVEATMLSSNGSVADDGASTPGQSAGLGAWIETNEANASTTTGGGFQTTGLVTARTGYDSGSVALTESAVRAVSKAIYEEGGEAVVAMGTPSVIESFSSYLFTSSARVAALQSDVNQQRSAVTATGAVNVFVSDFSTLEMVPNRIQPAEATGVSNLYILDPSMLRLSFLHGYRVEPQAKTGLADKRQMCVDWSLKVLNEKAQGAVFNIDETAPVTA